MAVGAAVIVVGVRPRRVEDAHVVHVVARVAGFVPPAGLLGMEVELERTLVVCL